MSSYQTTGKNICFRINLFFSSSYFACLAYTHIHELIDTWTRHAQAIETQGTQRATQKHIFLFVFHCF